MQRATAMPSAIFESNNIVVSPHHLDGADVMPDITAACLTSRTPTRHRTQAWSGPSIGVKKRHQGLGRFLHLAAIARSRADVTNSRIGAECAGDHADTGYKL